MISFYQIKPKFQALLLPILKFLHRNGVTANAITWSAILVSIFTGIYCYFFPSYGALLLLPSSLLIRMALNALDGMMARNYNMQSIQGEILNELGDVLSDFVMFYPIGVLFQLERPLLIAFLFLALVNEFVGILGKAINGIRRYDGPMGKSDRAFVVGIVALSLFFFPAFVGMTNYIFLFVCILLLISSSVRIFKTLKTTV